MLLNGDDVFDMSGKHLLQKLERLNKGAFVLYSIVYFPDIGLTACNYLDKNGKVLRPRDEDDDERGVGVFRKGVFDDVLKDATPISFASL